ncbi:hypothetical protein AAG570_011312 [Ranatra chinensis]|uniref:Uncharacterized protein n=1 Tax=Ranatra chinensis TaxID=642074 RepID=A0ABD0Z8K1_9HEMI
MASKRRNMFHKNKTQETTEEEVCPMLTDLLLIYLANSLSRDVQRYVYDRRIRNSGSDLPQQPFERRRFYTTGESAFHSTHPVMNIGAVWVVDSRDTSYDPNNTAEHGDRPKPVWTNKLGATVASQPTDRTGGYVRIGSVRVRVRQDGAGVGDEGEEEDCCCGVGRSGGRKEPVAVPTPDRNSVQSRDRHSCAPTGCNPWQHYSKLERREREPPPATALDRLPRLRLGGPERPGSRHHKKKPRSSDKTERLRELTEKLKAPAKAEAAPPPSPAPAAPAEPPPSAARTPTSDELFEVNLNLAKPESRTIVGSYIQRTIPFRSASFSQVDFSSADGKYIRNARNAAVANKAGASLSLPRKKLSEGCRTVVYSDGIPAASDLSIDSAVGSEEWSIPEELPAIGDDSEQCKSGRSLTHPLGARRGSRPDRDLPYSSIDGNGLKSLQTTSGSGERPPLEGVKEESDADSAAATSDAASSSAGVRDRLTDHELTSDWVRSIPDERPPASPEPEKPEAPSAYEVISEEQQEKTLEIDRENGNCEDDLIAVDEKTENKRENDLSSNGDEKIVNEVTPERVTVETPLCDVDKKNPEINTQLTVTVATTNNGVSSPSGGVEFAPGIIYPSSAQEEPQSPEEFSRPRWPHHGRRRPGLVCQSSEEKDEDAEGSPGGPCRLGHRRHSPTRTDSLSEGESDNGRPLTPTNRDRTSPSLFGPSDQSDCECRLARGAQHTRRYSKRPLRGPYGQMLEAEMKKPEAGKFSKHNDDLKFLEEYVQPNRENRAADDIRIGSTCNSLSPPSERHGPATPVTLKPTPKRKVSANIPYSAPEPTATSADQALLVHHQRTTSSPSQLEGCSNQKQEAFLAHLLKGSSERSLTEPSTTPLLTSQRKVDICLFLP